MPVAYSLQQLNQTMARVTTDEPWASAAGDLLSTWYVDPAIDKVHVGLTTVTPALREAASKAFGDKVEPFQQQRYVSAVKQTEVPSGQLRIVHHAAANPPATVRPFVPNRLLDGEPYYGGDRILWWETCQNGTMTCIHMCTANVEVFSASFIR